MGEGVISGWIEGILFSLAFVLILGVAVTNFNGLYGEDHQIGLGTNTTADAFSNYQDTAGGQITGGEVDFDSASGITLRSSWGVVKNVFSIVSNFLTGGWIEDIASMTNLGEAGQIYAKYLRIVWVLSLILAILYILFKVKA
jgi:hypothetical protein